MGEFEVLRSVIDDVAHDPRARRLMDELDIDISDQVKLANILDFDHSGSIKLVEFMHGVQILRGVPRRGDIISVELVSEGIGENVERILTLLRRSASYRHTETE